MMSSNKGKRPLRHLTAGDKIEAIQRIHDGESKASVARDIGVPESTLRGWCKNEEKLRYMSRQSGTDCKMSIEKLTEKMADDAAMAATSGLFGPPEKRAKLDTSMPSMSYALGNNGKLKYDDLTGSNSYKSRSSMSALDFSNVDKSMSSINFNGLAADYTAAYNKASAEMMNGHAKMGKDALMKGYGGVADLSKSTGGDHMKTDMTMPSMSPLTSLSHLSGMSGLAQAMSYNELASNLSLLYNNPSALSSMAGLGNYGSATTSTPNVNNTSSSRSSRQKSQSSPRSDIEKGQSLTVKNLAKLQQKSSSSSMDTGLDMSDKMKKPSATTVSQTPPVDEAVLYWLRSQQAMLGLNNLYSSMPTAAAATSSSAPTASPHRASPHQLQQQIQQLQANLLPGTPSPFNQQTPSTTPSGISEDTKNSAWFMQWYKTLGSQLLNDKQSAAAAANNNNNNTISSSMMSSSKNMPASYDILYSQLTKDMRNSPSPRRSASTSHGLHTVSPDSLTNNHLDEQNNNKPEDLSAGTSTVSSRPVATSSPDPNSPDGSSSPARDNTSIKVESPAASPISTSLTTPVEPSSDDLLPAAAIKTEPSRTKSASPSDVRSVLDNLLFSHQLNNNNTTNSNNNIGSPRNSESDTLDSDTSSSPGEAVEHGEKFLKWLESCSDPNITAMQVMQFRTLLNSIRSKADRENNPIVPVLVSEERSRKRSRK